MADEKVTSPAQAAEVVEEEAPQSAESAAQQNSPEADTPGAVQPAEGEAAETPEISKAQFGRLDKKAPHSDPNRKIEMLLDVKLPVTIELGRTRMFMKEILELERGSIVELDKMAGEPVDLYVNDKKMAEGEVVVVDKQFGIRITHLIDPADRIKNLGKE